MKRNKWNFRKRILSGILLVCMVLTCFSSVSNAATTLTPEEQFRQLCLRLYETGDHSVQDITDLNLPYMTCHDIINEVRANEGFLAYQCYENYQLMEIDEMEYLGTKVDQIFLRKFHLGETEDTNFAKRYAYIHEVIAEMKSTFDDKMTDLDKLLWIHEYIDEKIYYKDANTLKEHLAVPALMQGYGVCESYARLLILFLKEFDIPCQPVSGGGHAWVAVKIDGKWYHVDPTWDDTGACSGAHHYFLMRNDEEYRSTLNHLHTWSRESNYTDEVSKTISTSTDYTDWYVHNVRNRMYYYDSYWYYVLNNAIRKNNIKGTDETIICEGNNLSIKGIENGTLTYSVGSEEKQLVLTNKDKEEASTEKATTTEKTTQVTTQIDEDEDEDWDDTKKKTTQATTETATTTEKSTQTTTETATTTESDDDDDDEDEDWDDEDWDEDDDDDEDSPSSQKAKSRIPVIKSITNKKGSKVKIVLKKKIAGADGYQLVYSTNRNFKKSVKKVNFKGTSKTISKLRKNKIYYIKVRAFKKNASGKKVYSKYSKVKKIKIKK
ncbi:MAG: transglutaminase-like domain-containing protein [Clostridiales bacterium]|nr:transglutaminase-like domain-containing protein [Clostridiales bacterium]